MEFPETLLVGEFEKHIGCWLRSGNSWEDPLTLNLAEVSWIDVPALIYIAALVGDRSRMRLETTLKVPRSKRVRDFLRLWRFQAGIREITGLPFSFLVAREDLKYFGEDQDSYLQAKSGDPTNQIVLELTRRRFFGLIGHQVEGKSIDEAIIRQKWNHWRGHMIMQVLNNLLPGRRGSDISRVVIYEAMANSLQHPSASVMASVSKVDASVLGGAPSMSNQMLTLSFWDNGQGIVDTLGQCLQSGLPVRAKVDGGLLKDNVKAKFYTNEGLIRKKTIGFDWTPKMDSGASLILLSSIFPGVTRKVCQEVPAVASVEAFEGVPLNAPESSPGMGLYALLRTVVDGLGGSIAIRTGGLFMNVKANAAEKGKPTEAKYQAKILEHSAEIPAFYGNMVSIRIPLKHSKLTK